jgi:hypothetical protein
MSPDYAQRRRVALAAAITAILAPAAFLLDRGGEPTPVVTPVVASVVENDPSDDSTGSSSGGSGSDTDPMGTTPAAFLEPTGTVAVGDPATIAIPRLPDLIEGHATFSRSVTASTSCEVAARHGAPPGAVVTVTNRDNSRSIRCVNEVVGLDPDDDVVLHPEAFARIADLTDAPVPITFDW